MKPLELGADVVVHSATKFYGVCLLRWKQVQVEGLKYPCPFMNLNHIFTLCRRARGCDGWFRVHQNS
jgi:hypothetical protein